MLFITDCFMAKLSVKLMLTSELCGTKKSASKAFVTVLLMTLATSTTTIGEGTIGISNKESDCYKLLLQNLFMNFDLILKFSCLHPLD